MTAPMNAAVPAPLQAIAQALVHARRTGSTWSPAVDQPAPTAEEAYAIQAAVAAEMGWFPRGPSAWKVGGTTDISAAPLPEVREGSGSEPVVWTLPAGQDLVLIEAELAFRLARTPEVTDTPEAIRACLGTVCVAIELIGTRLAQGLAAPSAWKLADQGVHAGLVIGSEVPGARHVAFSQAEWAAKGCHIRVVGEPEPDTLRARGAHPTVNPLLTLPWLVRHAAAHTGGLHAGDLITTGACLVRWVKRGELAEVGFEGLAPVRLQVV
jgi:2-keto-4-pentenoate hydratase